MAHRQNPSRPVQQGTDDNPLTEECTTAESSPPKAAPRWFYAKDGGDDWAAFPEVDDKALEARFQALGGEQWQCSKRQRTEDDAARVKAAEDDEQDPDKSTKWQKSAKEHDAEHDASSAPKADEAGSQGWTRLFTRLWNTDSADEDHKGTNKDKDAAKSDRERKLVEEILDPDETEADRQTKVAVLEDRLFDVDLDTLHLYPVFFKGVLLPVVRATWFYWSEMRDEYSPIEWDSDLAKDLEDVWQTGRIWEMAQGTDKEDGNNQDTAQGSTQRRQSGDPAQMSEIRTDGKGGKGRVKFSSPVEGSVYSEDIRGRIISLVGGSTVIRGFQEIQRRTSTSRSLFGVSMPDMPMPWKGREGESDEQQARDNDAVRATGKAGAAQPGPSKTSSSAADGRSGGEEALEADTDSTDQNTSQGGFVGRLWPSSDSILRPRLAFYRLLGLSPAGAEQEAKQKQRHQTTDQATQPDRESTPATEGEEAAQSSLDTDSSRDEDDGDGASVQEENTDMTDCEDEPPHLCLVIHGIGQGIIDDFESLDFTWDVQKLRNLSRERAQDVGVRKLSRGRRVQYLPVCWRRGLKLEHQSAENDNHFKLSDVTNDATIPFVRNVVSKVILDVPFFLSPIFKEKMVEAVTMEANRIYRLFVKRNPHFLERGGQVSLICHSLGSALAAEILSNQPTTVPAYKGLSSEAIREAHKTRLLFNVVHCFLVGSPLGLFLLLGGGQLIARRTEQNKDVGDDATCDQSGRYGCFALHGSLFNCYDSADPVAYRLNGAVDEGYAKLLRPLPLPGAVTAILDALKQPRLSVSKLFDPLRPFASAGKTNSANKTGSLADFVNNFSRQSQRLPAEDGTKQDAVRHGETRDQRMDDDDKHRWTDAGGKSHTDEAGHDKSKGRRGETDGPEEEGDDTQNETSLPSGIVTPVHVEEGDAAKRSLPQRMMTAQQQQGQADIDTGDRTVFDGQQEGPSTQAANSVNLRDSPLSLSSLAKAERRFRALNPHGTLDFYFSSSSGASAAWGGEYISMLSAHNGYWTSNSFVSLVLTQLHSPGHGGAKDGEERSASSHAAANVAEPTLIPQIADPSDL
ncbi:unnamed protein product [Parajaminaea phylloscopi]